jgi:hypothetical protein
MTSESLLPESSKAGATEAPGREEVSVHCGFSGSAAERLSGRASLQLDRDHPRLARLAHCSSGHNLLAIYRLEGFYFTLTFVIREVVEKLQYSPRRDPSTTNSQLTRDCQLLSI